MKRTSYPIVPLECGGAQVPFEYAMADRVGGEDQKIKAEETTDENQFFVTTAAYVFEIGLPSI